MSNNELHMKAAMEKSEVGPMRILVTGGAGFIGSNFVQHLFTKNSSIEIWVVDNLNYRGNLENFPSVIWNSPRFKFIYGDICNERLMVRLMSQVDQVVNFAAWSFVDKSFDNSADFVRSDVEGVRCLMEALRVSTSCKKFVHISTSEVYGTALISPMTEDHQLDPCSIYAASKCGGDRLAKAYWITHNLPIVIVRPFNNYGPNQYTENWIPKVITSVLSDSSIPLFGDGSAKRDWLHVKDNCAGICKALSIGKPGEAYNLCTGVATSTRDLMQKICDLLPTYDVKIVEQPSRPGEVKIHCGSSEKARRDLAWTPEYTLDQGLEKTVEWYVNNKEWWVRRGMNL